MGQSSYELEAVEFGADVVRQNPCFQGHFCSRKLITNLRMPSYEGFQSSGRTPLRVYNTQPTYKTYISPYGPKTKHQPNLMGLTATKAVRYGAILSGFGVATGIFAIFFFAEVPKVRNDILTKVPVIGDYFVREIPPEDNPF